MFDVNIKERENGEGRGRDYSRGAIILNFFVKWEAIFRGRQLIEGMLLLFLLLSIAIV